jgi:hypothetical protein
LERFLCPEARAFGLPLFFADRARLSGAPPLGRQTDVSVVVADATAFHPPEHLFDVLPGEVNEREAVVASWNRKAVMRTTTAGRTQTNRPSISSPTKRDETGNLNRG